MCVCVFVGDVLMGRREARRYGGLFAMCGEGYGGSLVMNFGKGAVGVFAVEFSSFSVCLYTYIRRISSGTIMARTALNLPWSSG